MSKRSNSNARYFNAAVARQLDVVAFTNKLVHDAMDIIRKNDVLLALFLRERLPALRDINPHSPILIDILRQIVQRRRAVLREIQQLLKDRQQDFSTQEADKESAIILAALTPLISNLVPYSAEVIRQGIDSPSFLRGISLNDWFSKLIDRDSFNIASRIQQGIVEREAADSIVAGLFGTATASFDDGIMAMTRRYLASGFQAAITHFAEAAHQAVWAANSVLISHLRWTAILDNKTSWICRARDGHNAPVRPGGDAPSPLLVPPSARPPAHEHCRSRMVAVFIGGGAIPTLGYVGWLKLQPAAVQNDLLGVTKAELFRAGKTDLSSFVDRRGRELTLEEIANRDPAAFARADLDTSEFT